MPFVVGRWPIGIASTAAAHYADIAAARAAATRAAAGRPIAMADAQIAAIVRSHGAILVTRNVTDFIGTGVTLVDPWKPPGAGR